MKKRILLCGAVAVLCVVASLLVWWCMPTVFLEDVDPNTLVRIDVFNGTTGTCFSITDAEDITHIVKNIQSAKMKKSGYGAVDGFVYSMSFYAASGSRVGGFTLNSASVIRDGDVQYTCAEGTLCFEYIKAIEAK